MAPQGTTGDKVYFRRVDSDIGHYGKNCLLTMMRNFHPQGTKPSMRHGSDIVVTIPCAGVTGDRHFPQGTKSCRILAKCRSPQGTRPTQGTNVPPGT